MTRRARTGTSQTEKGYTERALRFLKRKIPKIVYLPSVLRGHNTTITTDALVVRITGPEIADNHLRIQEADPLGHIIARMHGLPIPRFAVRCGAPGCLNENQDAKPCDPSHADYEPTVRVLYHTPSPAEQEAAARWLATRITFLTPSAYFQEYLKTGLAPRPGGRLQHAHDYEAMIRTAVEQSKISPELQDAVVALDEAPKAATFDDPKAAMDYLSGDEE